VYGGGRLDGGRDRPVIGDIGLPVDRVLRQAGDRLDMARDQEQPMAFPRKRHRQGLPDPGARAGDHDEGQRLIRCLTHRCNLLPVCLSGSGAAF